MSLFWSVPSLRLMFLGLRVTLSADAVLCIPFSSTMLVSRDIDMSWNPLTVFDNPFVKSALAFCAESGSCSSCLSAMVRCHRESCGLCWTVFLESALVTGLGRIKFNISLPLEDVQLGEESVWKGNWLWQLCHIA